MAARGARVGGVSAGVAALRDCGYAAAASGGYLGGAANPMTPQEERAAVVRRALPSRPVSHTPTLGSPQGDRPAVAQANPLHLDNWQLASRSLI